MRALARVQAEALRRRGADVLLVTSDQHPESDTARDYELVLDPRFRTASSWPVTLAAWRKVLDYRPDVVIADEALTSAYGLGAMPMTVLIDRQGRVAATSTGVVDRAACDKAIQSLLREPAAGP